MALIADRILTIRDGALAGNERVEPRSPEEVFSAEPSELSLPMLEPHT
jgi:hypothetical protein